MQITGARRDRTHFAQVGYDAGKHDLSAHETFDRIGTEFFAAERRKPTRQSIERDACERVDAPCSNSFFSVQQDSLVYKISIDKTCRNHRTPFDHQTRDALIGERLEDLLQIEAAATVIDAKDLAAL